MTVEEKILIQIREALRNSGTTVTIGTALPAGTNNIGDVDVLSIIPGTGATNLGKAEDAAHTTGDTGVMILAVRQDTQTALAGTTGDYIPLSTDELGFLKTVPKPHATSTLSNVAASASSVTVLASNANRKAGTIYNDSTATLYLKYGATASTTSFTVKMFQDDYHEIHGNYTGIIDGIWSSATGSARITEITA